MREPDGRRARGQRTRASILASAVDLASVEGLEGLTIGRLATSLEMSKSGLFAHFGSKEELQLEVIQAAREIFVERIVEPTRAIERGLPRLRALLDAKLDYLRGGVFRGGCFFDAARAEFDSRPPGPVRAAVEQQMVDWSELMTKLVAAAQREGHIDPDLEPAQLAFELDSYYSAANVAFQFHGDPAIFDRAHQAATQRLESAAVKPSAPVRTSRR
jgi:AcrR family transcriptional regulator